MPKKSRPTYNEDGTQEDREEDEFKEEDLSDDEEARRRRRRPKGAAQPQRKRLITEEYLPNSMSKLRACVFCKLVLNLEKWRKLEVCPNCPDSRGLEDTTDCFESLISLILPRKSWVAEWQQMRDLIPALYAMAIAASPYDLGDNSDEEEDPNRQAKGLPFK